MLPLGNSKLRLSAVHATSLSRTRWARRSRVGITNMMKNTEFYLNA
jgi:hypothetical protein